MLFQPFQHGAHAASGEGNAGIRRAVIQMERVAIGRERVAARKDDVTHIAVLFVRLFRTEDPFVAAFETVLRRVQIKQRQSQAIDAPSRGLLDTVINN